MQRSWKIAALLWSASACLRVEPEPEDPAASTLRGHVLVMAAQHALDPEGPAARQVRRGRRALELASEGHPVQAAAIEGAGALRATPLARAHTDAARAREPAGADAKATLRWRPGEVLVWLEQRDPSVRAHIARDVEQALAKLGEADIQVGVRECLLDRLCTLTLQGEPGKPIDAQRTAGVAAALHHSRMPGVRVVARNFYKTAFRVPNDPHLGYQWHYDFARLPAAWDITTGDESVTIAVVDSGLNITHPDIVTRVAPGVDMISDPGVAGDGNARDPDPTDPGDGALGNGQSSWHGTHVAGIIAAETNNGEGVAGVTWAGKVVPIRVLGMGAQGYDSDILSGLAWAVGVEVEDVPPNQFPAKVVNLSLGGPTDEEGRQIWVEIVDLITRQDAASFGYPILVTAAGNSNQTVEDVVPANIPGMITVGASRFDGKRAAYSNWGPSVDILAPGGQTNVDQNVDGLPDGILSLYANEYEYEQGTSMAAPHVSGIVALAVAVEPSLDHARAHELLRNTANLAGRCNEGCGQGHVDAAAVLQAVGGAVSPEPRLAIDVTRVVFQEGEVEQGFRVLNIGGAPLTWTATLSGPQADLFALTPASGTVPAQGAMPVTLGLVRGELGAGSANLIFTAQSPSGEQSARVDVSFSEAVPVFVNLQGVQVSAFRVDAAGNMVLAYGPVLARRAEDFAFELTGVAPGQYFVYGVGDDNNDGTFDPRRESVGAWPVASNPTLIDVAPHTIYEGIAFSLSRGFTTADSGAVGAPCAANLDCTFAPDAECITSWQGGYCSRICDDGYCGAGGSCEQIECDGPCNVCLLGCASSGQCRQEDGFICDAYGTCSPPNF